MFIPPKPPNKDQKEINPNELMGMLYMINSKLDMMNAKLDILLVQNNTEDQQTAESERGQGEYKKKSDETTYMG